jgi:hypothetical protein
MVSCLKNSDGLVYAYIEWYVLNEKGQFEENAKYCFVKDLWIHDSHRHGGALGGLVKLMDEAPQGKSCEWVYWNNLKHNERQTKPFRRSRLAKLGEYHGF